MSFFRRGKQIEMVITSEEGTEAQKGAADQINYSQADKEILQSEWNRPDTEPAGERVEKAHKKIKKTHAKKKGNELVTEGEREGKVAYYVGGVQNLWEIIMYARLRQEAMEIAIEQARKNGGFVIGYNGRIVADFTKNGVVDGVVVESSGGSGGRGSNARPQEYPSGYNSADRVMARKTEKNAGKRNDVSGSTDLNTTTNALKRNPDLKNRIGRK